MSSTIDCAAKARAAEVRAAEEVRAEKGRAAKARAAKARAAEASVAEARIVEAPISEARVAKDWSAEDRGGDHCAFEGSGDGDASKKHHAVEAALVHVFTMYCLVNMIADAWRRFLVQLLSTHYRFKGIFLQECSR